MPGTEGTTWEVVSALLDELLDADDAQRASRLRQVRTENPALADQMETLLAQHSAVQNKQFLEGAAVDPFKLADLIGRTFAGYTLERQLGHGGMGSVWLARRSDGRYEGQAAVKLLNLGSLGRSGAERLRHEANALAKLSHPNITHLIDAGVDAGQPYLILEYIDGEPIDLYCDARQLGVEARLKLFLQVLAAVSHAHGRLLLHRDLKPTNILVTKEGTAKLLDFGIAKLLEGESRTAPPSDLTRLGGGAMTPEYAAPEQMQRTEVTTATDVYALGVLLYVLLIGRHPTASATGTPIEQMRALVEAEPKRLSDAAVDSYPEIAKLRGTSPLQLTRALSGDLDNIIAKALKKAPAERYATVDAFARDIQNHLNDEPVTARPDSAAYRLGKFVRRHSFAVAAVSLIVVSLVAGIVSTAWQARESARQRDAARFQAQRAEASSEFMSLMLEEVGPGGRPLSPIELVDRGVQLLDKRYSEDPPFAARMLLQMSRRYMDLGDTDKQTVVLERALSIAKEQNDPELLAAIECSIARTEIDATRYDSAEQHMQTARAALARSQADVATQVDCLRSESEIVVAKQDMDAGIAFLTKAQKLLEESDQTRGLQYHAVLTDLGGLYFRTSRFRETLALNQRTLDALDRNGRGGTIGRVTTMINRASILLRLGEVTRAEAAMVDAIRRAEQLSEGNPLSSRYIVSHAIILNRLGRTDEAIPKLEAASRDLQAAGNTTWVLNSNYHLARALMISGKAEEALQLLTGIREEWSKNATANKDRLADLSRTLAEMELARGQLKEAKASIDESLALFGYPDAKPALNLTAALTTAARIYSGLKQHQEAEAFARAALKISEGIAREPSQSADVGEALLALAAVHQAKGDSTAAQTAAKQAVDALANGLGQSHALTRQAVDL